MDFYITKEEVVKALNTTLGVVEKRQTLPILANVLFDVDETRLKLTATDLESARGQHRARGSSTRVARPTRAGRGDASGEAEKVWGLRFVCANSDKSERCGCARARAERESL